LNRYDSKTDQFQRFRHDPIDSNSLSHDVVYDVHEDHAGSLWIGTERGLNRFIGPALVVRMGVIASPNSYDTTTIPMILPV
jgi:ligand-binding sensor domain-containing protein